MSQLRSFKGLGQTAPFLISAIPCNLVDLDGTTAGSGVWLQLFDVAATSAVVGGAIPFKTFDVAAAGPLPSVFQTLGPITFHFGCVVALSSTQDTYTAAANATDYIGEIEEWEFPVTGYTPGPLGTYRAPASTTSNGVNTMTVWADGAGPQKLVRLVITELLGNLQTVWIKTSSTENVGFYVGPLPASATTTFDFGAGGILPMAMDRSFVTTTGCYILIVNSFSFNFSTGLWTWAQLGGGEANITAYYFSE